MPHFPLEVQGSLVLFFVLGHMHHRLFFELFLGLQGHAFVLQLDIRLGITLVHFHAGQPEGKLLTERLACGHIHIQRRFRKEQRKVGRPQGTLREHSGQAVWRKARKEGGSVAEHEEWIRRRRHGGYGGSCC